jgi:diaminopimelate decarboxylase
MEHTADNLKKKSGNKTPLLEALSAQHYFSYAPSNELQCEDVSIPEIASVTGTPFFVYSKRYFTDRFNTLTSALKDCPHKIFYAVKSNYNITIIRHLHQLGAGADVNSLGEMYRAEQAGVPPSEILLGGVGKSAEEIAYALERDILLFKVESVPELFLINKIAELSGKKARVALRINPDVDPLTHPYISTGLAENKFGIPIGEAEAIYLNSSLTNIEFVGMDMHLGSQISTIAPYSEAIDKLLTLCARLADAGVHLHHLDIGGGFGVQYSGEYEFPVANFSDAILTKLKNSGLTIFLEPGRFFSANSAALVTKILYLKSNGEKNFLVVDAGMSELIRPSLYGAFHQIIPVTPASGRNRKFDVVGPLCESSDFLGKNQEFPEPASGNLLAVLSAGAYGMAMASNYNARLRPPEILVDGSTWSVIRKRETLEQLIQNEIII